MEVSRVPVSLAQRSYDVLIGERLLENLRHFAESQKPTSIFLVTDSNVGPAHAEAVKNAVVANQILTVPAGESSKCQEQLGKLYDSVFATRRVDRHSLIVALGGGVVGDIGGYLAATLLRGIRYVQIPTSLLAMVDSSVGGKTAINHPTGKNLIGAFHQPAAVFCDLHFLKTLPLREYISALGEVVKTAVLAGEEMLAQLEASADKLLLWDLGTLRQIIEDCVRFKAEVVADDEMETTGRRATLNFGHTLAHVLETLWPGRWLHGEAVAIGITAALKLSVERSKLDERVAERVVSLLDKLGLPISIPADLDSVRMREVMAGDKKRAGQAVHFVVISGIGQAATLPCRLDEALADTLLGRGDA